MYTDFLGVDARSAAIKSFYKTLLGREPDLPGLELYTKNNYPLEVIYMSIYQSDEAIKYRRGVLEKEKREKFILPLSLAIFAKNSEKSIAMTINSVKTVVQEIIVVDTGSTDSTVDICKSLGARVYKVGFSDFGSIRTLTGHLARQKWVLGLDSDEMILQSDLKKFHPLLDRAEKEKIDIIGLPRRRWADLEMNVEVHPEAYPDWQMRLFRNDTNIYYERRVHETITGSDKILQSDDFPCIQHFQDSFKSGEALIARNASYVELMKLDLKEGVLHTEDVIHKVDIK